MYALLMLRILPIILFFSISPFATNVTTLLRSSLIALFAFIILIIKPIDFKKYKLFVLLFSTIIICFVISFIINEQNYSNFLIGTYGRNTGILALTGLFLLTLQSADYFSIDSNKLVSSLYVILALSLVYGIIQKLNLDPINWEKGAGLGATVGNPNYYGALLGFLSIIPLFYFLNPKSKYRYMHLVIYTLILIQTFIIGGSQGYIIFTFSLIVFIGIKFRERIFHRSKLVISSLIILFSSASLILLRNFANITTTLNSNLQFENRLEHWKLSLRIWQEHFLFGVGIENLSNFSGEFRNQTMRNWGLYILPDKSHNMFLDFFATGGLFAGLSWVVFIFFVYQKIFFLLKNINAKNQNGNVFVLSVIWSSWIFQTFFSPSHIVLDVCGMMVAGALIGLASKLKNESKSHAK
jgi:O-antigen ligase